MGADGCVSLVSNYREDEQRKLGAGDQYEPGDIDFEQQDAEYQDDVQNRIVLSNSTMMCNNKNGERDLLRVV